MTDLASWRKLYPFASHWLELADGQRLHYVDQQPASSAADTLLFVHGNPTWSFHWRTLIQAWQGRARCVAPDHLGCGLSQTVPGPPLRLSDRIDHLLRLVEELDLQGVTLVAQDWGGAIGLGALLREPARFSRIVLFNTGAFPPWYIPWRIRVCRFPVLGRLAVQGGNLFCRAALRMTVARRRQLDAEVADGYLAAYHSWRRRKAVFDFVLDIPRTSAHPTWLCLEQIEAELPSLAHLPALLVWGMRDWCFTPECLEKFAAVWPQAQIHRLDDVGHWVLEDAPEEARRLVEDFMWGPAVGPPHAAAAAVRTQPPGGRMQEGPAR